jgi:hypothetical protein
MPKTQETQPGNIIPNFPPHPPPPAHDIKPLPAPPLTLMGIVGIIVAGLFILGVAILIAYSVYVNWVRALSPQPLGYYSSPVNGTPSPIYVLAQPPPLNRIN